MISFSALIEIKVRNGKNYDPMFRINFPNTGNKLHKAENKVYI